MNDKLPERIIFLDIDGVLNTEFKDEDHFGQRFKPECVEQLKRIIDETGAAIVISSSWRLNGIEYMKNLWQYRNLPGEIIDLTPAGLLFTKNLTRGEEIYTWMCLHGVPNYYVIIDDDINMMGYQLSRFVRTETFTGLTEELADRAIKYLTEKENKPPY